IYCSSSMVNGQKRLQTFRVSYHESGQVWLHLLTTLKRSEDEEFPPSEFKGAKLLSAGGSAIRGDADFVYVPKKDSLRRRNLIVPIEQLTRALSVEYWVLEPGNNEAVELAKRGEGENEIGKPRLELIDYCLADWTVPNVAIMVKTIPM